jgi:indolepyruvate ferredoxin oxidoreductase beta subunit
MNMQMKPQVKPITIAILALGGQGGGTLADWLIEVAERNGYIAQGTSVPGVAQRTGATIYYVELFPEAAAKAAGRDPVLALMPVPGNLDVVIAAELMEAGRAMMRGFVTPDRTALIASSHRVYAIAEKMAMGDGRANSDEVAAAAAAQSKSLVMFDMEDLARAKNSMISAVLFGALAASGTLPFPKESYEEVIGGNARGRTTNLAAFAAGFDGIGAPVPPPAVAPIAATAIGQKLLDHMAAICPSEVHEMVQHGIRKVVDYQDPAYGFLYLQRLAPIVILDRLTGGTKQDWILTKETARYLALWMAFEDVYRVADLKTRTPRFARIRDEVHAPADQIMNVSEFMHPRVEEICDALPAAIGRYILASPRLRGLLGRLFAHGRRVTTTHLGGFLMLYALASLRGFRRGSLRFQAETTKLEAWLASVGEAAEKDYALAVEVACCQRLVKGYGSTHERGTRNFETVMSAYRRLRGQAAAADKLRRLREAALGDEEGAALARERAVLGL